MGLRSALQCGLVVCVCGTVLSTTHAAVADPKPAIEPIVIVLGGDLGLGGSRQPISARGGYRHGRMRAWSALTKGIAPLINGDLNFANLETVVTDRRRLRPTGKLYNFRMHPAGVRHLVDVGFNVFSTANNHAIDYGQAGMRETLRHLTALRAGGLLAAPGIGRGRAGALRPAELNLKGHEIAISAIGIGGARLVGDTTRMGQMAYRSNVDFADAVAALSGVEADYRILSVHYGRERQIRPSASAVRRLRDQAIRGADVDLVVGHHAHVAAGVQRVGDKLIFYGLGNLLHLGMQNMAKFGACRDFGLLARLHVAAGPDGRLRPQAIEAIPLTNMHAAARAMSPRRGRRRIAVLNGLAAGLDDARAGARGVRFQVLKNGTGLSCLPGAEQLSGRIGSLCQTQLASGGRAAAVPARHCGHTVKSTARYRKRRTRKRRARRVRARSARKASHRTRRRRRSY
ncbi:MAG: CapA family protein [Hyphomicrobiaceae bacterium]